MQLGHPAGSAMPLIWAHSEYIKLIFFVDIPVSMQQQAPLRFTFFWTGSACFPFFYCEAGRWEGRDYEVSVV